MKIQLFDAASRHVATLDLEFGPNHWKLIETGAGWPGPARGRFAPVLAEPDSVALGAGIDATGALTGPVLHLSGMRHWESATAHAGSGTMLDAAGAKTDTRVMWSAAGTSPLSPARQWLLAHFKAHAPKGHVYSQGGRKPDGGHYSNPAWDKLTDHWTHDQVLAFFAADPALTTCNSVQGGVVRMMVKANGLQMRNQLKSGLIELWRADQDVPGCWIPARPGWYPRPGDIYSRSSIGKSSGFGHTGFVVRIEEGTLHTFDGGQDSRPTSGGAMYMSNAYAALNVNGWVDLDIWSYGRSVLRF